MAQPILFDAPKRDVREELRRRLEQAPLDHAEAILAGLDVLQGLQDHGILEGLRGALGGSDRILEMAVDAANTPEAIRGIRSLIIMMKLLGSIDPDQLNSAIEGEEKEVPSLWAIGKQATTKDARRGMATAVGLLNVFGAALNQQQAKPRHE
jgi:uncharacterized protein YjgD (DUF1641 family)